MIYGFKIEIYPDEKQAELLHYYCKIAHDMYNFLVAKYKDKLPSTTTHGLVGYTPQELMTDFGVEIPQRIVLGVLKTYSHAVERFWTGLANPPKFHKFNPHKQSFYISSCKRTIRSNSVPIPLMQSEEVEMSKRIPVNMEFVNKMNMRRITEPRFTYCNGRWYLSGSFDAPDVEKRPNLEYIGLDWGIKNFMTTSDGQIINYPESVLREYQRISRLKHYMDKKVYGSKNWHKVHRRMLKAYERMANLKKDFIQKTTTELCKDNNIVVEDLTDILQRRRIKAFRRISKIAPRYDFVRALEWKCKKFGTTFVVVNPAYTSKTCSCCGKIDHNLTLSDRVFICECGNIMDRDVNAARNLVARAVCCSH